ERMNRVLRSLFFGDTFPPMRLPESQAVMAKLDTMMKRGCGLVPLLGSAADARPNIVIIGADAKYRCPGASGRSAR
ncbi:MAG: hypothetical protein U0984_19505, partial [Prosthecobacter sp.]|nr:hypothetical protein [Prosthecobacter sp.]